MERMVFAPPMMSTLFALFFVSFLMLSLVLMFESSTLSQVMGAIRIDGLGIWEESSAMGVMILPVLVLVYRLDAFLLLNLVV